MQTVSKNNSSSTSVSVLMINAQGIMLSVLGHDYFLSYNRIPWMQDAPIRSVLNVQMSGPGFPLFVSLRCRSKCRKGI